MLKVQKKDNFADFSFPAYFDSFLNILTLLLRETKIDLPSFFNGRGYPLHASDSRFAALHYFSSYCICFPLSQGQNVFRKHDHEPWPFFCQHLWCMYNLSMYTMSMRCTRLVARSLLCIYCMQCAAHYSWHAVIVDPSQIYELHLYCFDHRGALITNTSSLITSPTSCVVLWMDY